MNFKLRSLVAATLAGSMLMGFGANAMADSTDDILNALIAKGVLTEEEGALLQKGRTGEKEASAKKKESAITASFKDGIKFESGDKANSMSINGRIQADYRTFDTPKSTTPGAVLSPENADKFDMRRAYLTAKGRVYNFVNYEATLDAGALKYYFLEADFSEKLKVRFGQFKMPMGLEQLTSSRFIDMTERDWVATLAPAVNKGIMIHGVAMPGLTYAASVSNGGLLADSGQAATETGSTADGAAYNGRVTANISQLADIKNTILHVGGAYGRDQNLPTLAVDAIKFQTNARGTKFFATNVASSTVLYSNPDVVRYGLEGIAAYGPVKLQSEYAEMKFEQAGKVDKAIKASYVNLSWMLTGESYSDSYKNGVMDRMRPKNDYTGFGSAGWGAIELGLRYSKFDAKDFVSGTDFAATASSNDVDSWTAGAKWIVNPNTRFLLDYVYTDFNKNIFGSTSGASAALALNAPMDNEKAINFRAQFDF